MKRKSDFVIVIPLSSNVRDNWRTKCILKHLFGYNEIVSVFFYWNAFAPANILHVYMFVKTFEWFYNWEQSRLIIE